MRMFSQNTRPYGALVVAEMSALDFCTLSPVAKFGRLSIQIMAQANSSR